MVWFYTRGMERRSCETRLAADGRKAFELVIREPGKAHVERVTRSAEADGAGASVAHRMAGAGMEKCGKRLRGRSVGLVAASRPSVWNGPAAGSASPSLCPLVGVDLFASPFVCSGR